MNKGSSSNLATPTNESLEKSRLFSKVRQAKRKNAPSIYDIVFMVEGPNDLYQNNMLDIKCIDCNGNVNKRWYVEYYLVNPETKKRIRKREYGRVNYQKDPLKRMELLVDLKRSILLNFEISNKETQQFATNDKENITYYLNEYLRDKRQTLRRASIKNITGTLVYFHEYLKTKNLTRIAPNQITKAHIKDFKLSLPSHLSNRSIKNHIEFLNGFFNYLINSYDNVITKNPCKGIEKPISRSETHVAFSTKQANEIINYLQEHDVNTLNFCRFIALGFLRPNEIITLKVGDIDFEKRTITLTAKHAKTTKRTVKPILNIFYNYLIQMNIKDYPANYYIFTTKGVPGIKQAYGNCFSKRFKKVKTKFGYSKLHTMYGFRHTIISDLIESGADWTEIMKYTGHKTFEAFQKYARSIMNKPAVDLSNNIKIKF